MCFTNKLGNCIGNVIYVSERIASCCALTALITCLITTLILMLAFGIGLGYNYCFVDLQSKRTNEFPSVDSYNSLIATDLEEIDTLDGTNSVSLSKQLTEDDSSLKPTGKGDSFRRRFNHRTTKPNNDVVPRTMVIPLHEGVDFLSLLSKIKAQRTNVTLEILAP